MRTRHLRIYEKDFDGLSALVAGELGRDPLGGDLFLFVSRNRIRAKVLHWDGTGLCLYAKRLEKGKFACSQLDSQLDRRQARQPVATRVSAEGFTAKQ